MSSQGERILDSSSIYLQFCFYGTKQVFSKEFLLQTKKKKRKKKRFELKCYLRIVLKLLI